MSRCYSIAWNRLY